MPFQKPGAYLVLAATGRVLSNEASGTSVEPLLVSSSSQEDGHGYDKGISTS